MLKKIGTSLGLIIIGLLVFIYMKANPTPYNVKFTGELPSFSETKIGHTHNYNGAEFLPVIGSAVIDINNDGHLEVILGGGDSQADSFYKYEDGGFVSLGNLGINKQDKDVTYGISVIDLNKDGQNDLLLARESGGYKCINNSGKFSCEKINLFLNEKTRPISFALGDINKDGHIDLYVAGYLTRSAMEGQTIFKKENYGGTSKFLINNGDNTFSDQTQAAGLNYVHNTFLGIFIDIDRDSDLDLIAAHDTGQVKTWENLGNGQFKDHQNPFSGAYGYPMGIGVGDYDNNSYPDFYFSNTGSTVFEFLGRGDLKPEDKFYKSLPLFQNNGGFKLTDTAEAAKVANYEFSWGAVLADLNNDSKQDIVLSENYVDFPFHKIFKLPGRVLIQNESGEFSSQEAQLGLENRNYEIAPLVADFNNDGVLDQIRVNLAGTSKAFISNGATQNKFIKVQIPNQAEFFGAIVKANLNNGLSLTDDMVSGEGLGSDQDHKIHFGLGQAEVKSISVILPNGKKALKTNLNQKTFVSFTNEDFK